MGWTRSMDANGDLHLHSSLTPIRNRKNVSLEWRMRRLLDEADRFKAQIAKAEVQVQAYMRAAEVFKADTFFKIDIN